MKQLLKIQKGDVFIQLPDEKESLQYVMDVLTWYLKRLEKGEGK